MVGTRCMGNTLTGSAVVRRPQREVHVPSSQGQLSPVEISAVQAWIKQKHGIALPCR